MAETLFKERNRKIPEEQDYLYMFILRKEVTPEVCLAKIGRMRISTISTVLRVCMCDSESRDSLGQHSH